MLVVACGNDSQSQNGPVTLERAFPSLTFNHPLDLQFPDDGTNRLFVVEQPGTIKVFDNDSAVTSAKTFLDITDRVNNTGTEEGLLGLAFHPDYGNNGYFYVNYTASNPRRTVIGRFSVSAANPDSADPGGEFVVLEYDQPYSNHNGGCLAFGPDGYLYIAVGDGGSGGDPQGNGQNRKTLLGSILRIDVDNPSGGNNYGIPPDNPFVGNDSGYREEIYAYGLRNPWRFSFDPQNGRLWAADVGQNRYEEVDIIESGKNYGWNIMEGRHCYDPPTGCDTAGLTMPIVEYDHSVGNSITGGVVYHYPAISQLQGQYLYADFVTGRFWALSYEPGKTPIVTNLVDSDLNPASFGVDQHGQVYVCAFDGHLYRFAASGQD